MTVTMVDGIGKVTGNVLPAALNAMVTAGIKDTVREIHLAIESAGYESEIWIKSA
jgi:hypothetical protein